MTLDLSEEAQPDILFDLDAIESGSRIPVETGAFDEIHAYEVLEHYGRQGDFRGLFRGFNELHRILKPNGVLFGSCPSIQSPWLWGDPGHTRVISQEVLSFLTKEHYDQLGKTPSTDYRAYIAPHYWGLIHAKTDSHTFQFALQRR